MERSDADELVGYLDSNYNMNLHFDETGREMWVDFMLRQDVEIASVAVVRLIERQRQRPTISDVRNMIRKISADRAPTSAQIEPPKGDHRIPDWVGGWMVSRSRGDMREWPQQAAEYSQNKNLMPQEDCLKYQEDARRIGMTNIMKVRLYD